ncbi:hypothetical protein [Aliikangiella sp. IMCC44632]
MTQGAHNRSGGVNAVIGIVFVVAKTAVDVITVVVVITGVVET